MSELGTLASSSISISPMADINGDRAYSVLTIASLEETINRTKWQVRPSAGNSSCCIFRAPVGLVEINKITYEPQIVSIGPYHHGKSHLEMMQQHKRRYLHDFLAHQTSPKLNDYQQAVASKVEEIRGCYAESTLQFCDDELVDMMVLDGLFVIEFLCKKGKISKTRIKDDPVFHLAWIFSHVMGDLLRLENQIPFFVLQLLFDTSRASRQESNSSLAKLALDLFSDSVETPYRKHEAEAEPGKHLLDLLRLSFIAPLKPVDSETTSSFELIQSAQKLHASGIKFKAKKAKDGKAMSFLDISYSKGVLKIPLIKLDEFLTQLLLNFVAFEQCYSHYPRHMTTYAQFMSCLVRMPKDSTFLSEHNIIEKYIGTDEEVATFYRNMAAEVVFDPRKCYLLKQFKEVNMYQRKTRHVHLASLRIKYFDSPWSFLSALAAVILLLMTALQTFYAVYATEKN